MMKRCDVRDQANQIARDVVEAANDRHLTIPPSTARVCPSFGMFPAQNDDGDQ